MLSPDQLRKFSEEIKQTGFPFEHHVATAFEKEKWTIISNKYYLDDIQQVPREMDLIAYKMSKVKHLEVCTAIIISCKKSEENAWAFLSKKADFKNPNTNWWPLHVWSNDKIVNFEIDQPDKKKDYYKDAMAKGVLNVISNPTSEIFAFQEMKLSNGKPGNDKTIFSSINSLLQAQAYEFGALPERKKSPYVYQFNLLSILDGEMVKLNFDNKKVTPESVDNEHYLSRYIIKKKPIFSRILFLKKDALDETIKDYNRLHSANCEIFEKLHEDYFSWAIQDNKRRDLLLEEFRRKLYILSWWIERDYHQELKKEDFGLSWDTSKKILKVTINYDPSRGNDFFEKINEDKKINEKTSEILSEVYRYKGSFIFEDDIPF